MELVYLHKIGQTSDGLYMYELFFSEDSDSVRGYGWTALPAYEYAKRPEMGKIDEIYTLYTPDRLLSLLDEDDFDFNNQMCMKDAVDGAVALAWEQERPPKYGIVLKYGSSKDDIWECIYSRDRDGYSMESKE